MNSLLFAAMVAVCPRPVVEDMTDLKWTDTDEQTLEASAGQCAKRYPDAPCLSRFIKREFNMYRVMCGEKVVYRKFL